LKHDVVMIDVWRFGATISSESFKLLTRSILVKLLSKKDRALSHCCVAIWALVHYLQRSDLVLGKPWHHWSYEAEPWQNAGSILAGRVDRTTIAPRDVATAGAAIGATIGNVDGPGHGNLRA
jgi:hypothetical protein